MTLLPFFASYLELLLRLSAGLPVYVKTITTDNRINSRSLHSATPDSLSTLVALANFMRLSLLKAAHAGVGEWRVTGNPGALRSG
jgi:hypothetical protein